MLNLNPGNPAPALPVPGTPPGITPPPATVDLITKLFQLGWSLFQTLAQAQAGTTPAGLSFLQKIYSVFHGIGLTEVASHVNLPRMCSLPDVMNQVGSCKWPSGSITYSVIGTHHSFSAADFQEATAIALSRWASVANIKPVYKANDRTANVIVSASMIDGPFGILGQTQLPCGRVNSCTSIMDEGDNFGAFDGSNPSQIDLVRVMTHELGHALGLEHIGTGNLMAPVYNDKVWMPQSGDIQELQSRYGPPTTKTPPTPAGSANDYVLRFTNGALSVDGYRLSKLVA